MNFLKKTHEMKKLWQHGVKFSGSVLISAKIDFFKIDLEHNLARLL